MSSFIFVCKTTKFQSNATVAVAEIVRELIENGIKKDDIILAYNAVPFQKLDELIAV